MLLIMLAPAALFAAGGGKIHGKIVDKENGQPLPGATVRILGTTRGAVTDVNGEYYILNVEVGTYTLEASFVGYRSVQISNIIVNSNLTTEADFQLPKSAVQVAPVEIVARRPLIQKSATNETRIINSSYLSSIPIRNVTQAAALQPGVVMLGNFLYIRGSRPDATGYTINGVNVTDIYSGGRGVTIPQDAIEQIQVQTGGYPAEYGGANGGIVSTQLRTGGQKLHVSLQAETDNFTKQGQEALGTYSYGYSDYTGSISTPVVSNKIRFFGTVENKFYRDPGIFGALSANSINGSTGIGVNATQANPVFWNGIDFAGLIANPQYTNNSLFDAAHPNTALSDTLNLNYPAGNQLGGQLDQYMYTATLLFDLGDVQLEAAGSYSNLFSQDVAGIGNMFNLARLPINKYQNGFGNLKLTDFLTPKTYFELNLNYYRNLYETGLDPKYGMNWTAYGSPASNPSLNGGNTNLLNAPWNVFGPSSGGGLSINQPGTLIATGPALTSETSMGGRLDFSTEVSNNTIKVGGTYTYYTVRHYGAPAAGITAIYGIMNSNESMAAKAAALSVAGMNNYGYDVFGNVINSDIKVGNDIVDFGPPHPSDGAVYVQDNIELPDIILNVGLRYDYINPDSWSFKDPNFITYNDSLGVVSGSSMVKTAVSQQVSPRIGVSFPVSDKTVFHAQYGKFIQEAQLIDSYAGMGLIDNITAGGFFFQSPVGYGLRPERTTQYELGFSQQVGSNASFDITAFYKDIQDQIQYRQIIPQVGPNGENPQNRSYDALVNGDFGTSKGVELSVTLRRVDRIQAQLNYTFESAEATGSSASSSAGSATDQHGYTANIPFPTSFSQENTGSINIDYRFAKDDGGPILQRSGLDLLMSFGSGFPYTLESVSLNNLGDARFQVPLEPIGYSTTPWTFDLDVRVDKTVSFGPLDAMFYVYVQNLLDAHNAYNVFITTGDPANNGWLETTQGQQYAQAQYDPALYQQVYAAANFGNNANNYLPPRQIRFGVKLDY